MGNPVVHFEVMGKDGEKLRSYYSQLFGWEFTKPFGPDVPMEYSVIDRESNLNPDGAGIAGGIGTTPDGDDGYLTFYVEVADVEVALAQAESLGGTRVMGPDKVMDELELGMFTDPEGHLVGVVRTA